MVALRQFEAINHHILMRQANRVAIVFGQAVAIGHQFRIPLKSGYLHHTPPGQGPAQMPLATTPVQYRIAQGRNCSGECAGLLSFSARHINGGHLRQFRLPALGLGRQTG